MAPFDPHLFHTFSFVAVFIASVAGSLHCVGMCGGLVVLAGSSSRGPLMGQLTYNLGRGCGYLLLGGLAGIFGELSLHYIKFFLVPNSSVGPALAAFGLMFLCGGAFWVYQKRGKELVTISQRSWLTRFQEKLSRIPFMLGVSTAILPCPWLYSFVLLAAAGGDGVIGAKVMLAFWLGTLPALLVVGTIFEATLRAVLKRYPYISLLSILVAVVLSLGAHFAHNHSQHGGTHHDHAQHVH